jgi:hypothetical protein
MFLKAWLLVLLIGDGDVLAYFNTEKECETYRKNKLSHPIKYRTMCMRADIN